MSIIRDQIHLIKTEELTGPQIKTTSGKVYLSRDAQQSQDEIVDIVSTVKAVKAPFYGLPIPGTFAIATAPGVVVDTAVNIVSPTTNQTYQLLSVDVKNIGPTGTVSADLYLSDGASKVKLAAVASVAAGSQNAFDLSKLPGTLYFTKEVYIIGVPTAGTPGFCQFELAYCKVVQ